MSDIDAIASSASVNCYLWKILRKYLGASRIMIHTKLKVYNTFKLVYACETWTNVMQTSLNTFTKCLRTLLKGIDKPNS